MKILMIAPQPFFQPRGTPFSVLHRLIALTKLGHQIDLVTYHIGEDFPLENVTYYRIINLHFLKRIKVGPSKTKIILDIFVFLKAFRLLIKYNYDLIHSHEEAGFFATWLANLFKVLHLYDMHSSLPQQLINFKFTKHKPLLKLFEKLERYTILKADAIITICPELYNYVAQLFPDKQQILIENVADNSVIFKDEDCEDINIKDHYNLNSNLIILYSGTFEPYQGIDLLIEASKKVIAQFNHIRFLLVGGRKDQVQYYKNKVDEINLGKYFVFTGQVKPQIVHRYIELSDILVTPRIEGNNTPLKIYEYLRAGKPIIATNHITHTQVLNNQVALLTECNADSFANGIIKIIKNGRLRQHISENAKMLAQDKYSYETYLSKTKIIYDILERKKSFTKEMQ